MEDYNDVIPQPLKMVKFNDHIYGTFELPDIVMRFIDSPEFQRLRFLKQTGNTHWAFHTATHTRFQHSLGVAWLGWSLMNKLQTKRPDLKILTKHKIVACIAGLVHDIGHGPLSHLYEHLARRDEHNRPYCHETNSIIILETLWKRNFVYLNKLGLNDFDMFAVKEMIIGEFAVYDDHLSWMGSIVCDKHNGVDMDRVDYLQRDAAAVGISVSFDAERLLNSVDVVHNRLSWPIKESWNLQALFDTRYQLFLRVYTHRTAMAVDLMMNDAVYSYTAMGAWKHLDTFVRLRDAHLESGTMFWNRIMKRKFYKLITEFRVDSAISKEELYAVSKRLNNFLNEMGMATVATSAPVWVDYGMGTRDPFDALPFHDNDMSKRIWSRAIAGQLMRPRVFHQASIRVYYKKEDSATDAVCLALSEWSKHSGYDTTPLSRTKYWKSYI